MKIKSVFERDFREVEERFPKLRYVWSEKFKAWLITGSLDICDQDGVYWETFEVIILVPRAYPYCVPVLFETSEILPRDIDWHISKGGVCCYDIEHNLLVLSKKGIFLSDFIGTKIYSYFANQLIRLGGGNYAGGEYAHHFEGVVQYYQEMHGLSLQGTILVLQTLLQPLKLGRNGLCPCGSGRKLKKCHDLTMEELKSLGTAKIREDLRNLQTWQVTLKNG
jgi:SEC-C motif